jgi:putative ABC transport system permease protein
MYSIDANRFKYVSVISPSLDTQDVCDGTIAHELMSEPSIENAVPVVYYKINFSVPGSATHTAALGTDEKIRSEIMKKMNITLQEGVLPEQGKKEIAIDKKVAMNNNLEIGDFIGKDVDSAQSLPESYKITGILSSDTYISFIGDPDTSNTGIDSESKSLIIFHKKGHSEEAENVVEKYSSRKYNILTLKEYNKLFQQNSQTFNILDMIALFAVAVMSVCLTCFRYTQYFQSKEEYGILKAIGYSSGTIMKRTFREIMMNNITGYIVGIAISLIMSKFLMNAVFDMVGGIGITFSLKAIIYSLFAPLCTTLMLVLPVGKMMKKTDSLSIIEAH